MGGGKRYLLSRKKERFKLYGYLLRELSEEIERFEETARTCHIELGNKRNSVNGGSRTRKRNEASRNRGWSADFSRLFRAKAFVRYMYICVTLLLVRYATMATSFRDTFTGQCNTALFVTTRIAAKTYGNSQAFICLKKQVKGESYSARKKMAVKIKFLTTHAAIVAS